jgi:hypothetical protein
VDTPYLLTYESNGTTITMYRNGNAQTITETVGTNAGQWWADVTGRDNFAVGGSKTNTEANFLNGMIAELIVYETALNDAKRKKVEKYLMRKYGI